MFRRRAKEVRAREDRNPVFLADHRSRRNWCIEKRARRYIRTPREENTRGWTKKKSVTFPTAGEMFNKIICQREAELL